MKFKNLFLIFILLFSVASAFAAPPGQTLGVMNILYPKVDSIKVDDNFYFHLHAFDELGNILNNSDYTCNIHIYGPMGSHEIESVMVNDANGYDKEFIYNSSSNNELGWHSYNIWCYSVNEAGAISEPFRVTVDGTNKDTQGSALLAIVALIPLIFGLFMVLGASTLGDDHNALRIALFLLSPISVFVSLHFAIIGVVKYYGLTELQDAIGSTTYWMGWFFFALLTYFGIYAFYKAINAAAQRKDERLNY